MTLSYVSAGVAAAASGASPQVVATTVALAVNDILVIAMSYDNSGSSGADPITASAVPTTAAGAFTQVGSSTTSINDPGAASAGLCMEINIMQVTTAIPSGTNISIGWTGTVVVRAVAMAKVTSSTGRPLFVSTTGAGTNFIASAAPSFTTPQVNAGELVMAWTGHENGANITGDADTTNGTWGSIITTFNGAAATGMAVALQGKVVNARATQSYDPTGTSSDWIIGAIIIKELAPAIVPVMPPMIPADVGVW